MKNLLRIPPYRQISLFYRLGNSFCKGGKQAMYTGSLDFDFHNPICKRGNRYKWVLDENCPALV